MFAMISGSYTILSLLTYVYQVSQFCAFLWLEISYFYFGESEEPYQSSKLKMDAEDKFYLLVIFFY